MYSLFDYMFAPPTRTVYVVSEGQLNEMKLKQKNAEISNLKDQERQLEAAFDRQKQSIRDALAGLESEVKQLTPSEETTKDG